MSRCYLNAEPKKFPISKKNSDLQKRFRSPNKFQISKKVSDLQTSFRSPNKFQIYQVFGESECQYVPHDQWSASLTASTSDTLFWQGLEQVVDQLPHQRINPPSLWHAHIQLLLGHALPLVMQRKRSTPLHQMQLMPHQEASSPSMKHLTLQHQPDGPALAATADPATEKTGSTTAAPADSTTPVALRKKKKTELEALQEEREFSTGSSRPLVNQ